MNCNDILIELAREGRWNGADPRMEEHFQGCNSCRELAELFGPADELSSQGNLQPVTWERIASASQTAERVASEISSAAAKKPSRWSVALRTAATLLIGVVLGGWLAQSHAFGDREAPTSQFATELGTGQCDRLLAAIREAADTQICQSCQQPLERQAAHALAMCVVCH